jgi:hypothetical protein
VDAHLPGWLWPIALFGGLGAFIDFLIGRAGQDRARLFLETWWIKFDDVRWNNFGRKEALLAISLIDKLCGARFFSIRRLFFVLSVFVVFFSVGQLIAIAKSDKDIFPFKLLPYDVQLNIMYAIGLATSISITRRISKVVTILAGDNAWRNALVFITFLLGSYVYLSEWYPIVSLISYFAMLATISQRWETAMSLKDFIEQIFSQYEYAVLPLSPISLTNQVIAALYGPFSEPPDKVQLILPYAALSFARAAASYFPNFARIVMAMIFVGSFLLKPFLMRPLSLIWRRIVESDKPIFTLIFGGISSGAVIVNELAKHL